MQLLSLRSAVGEIRIICILLIVCAEDYEALLAKFDSFAEGLGVSFIFCSAGHRPTTA